MTIRELRVSSSWPFGNQGCMGGRLQESTGERELDVDEAREFWTWPFGCKGVKHQEITGEKGIRW